MILHIGADSSKHIMYPFIEFVNKYFDKNKHFFILCSAEKDKNIYENAITKDIFSQQDFFIEQIKNANKVIIHGLWYDELCRILLELNIFDKIIWSMWGGDFYFPKKQSSIKKEVFKRFSYFVNNPYEFDLFLKMYNIRKENKKLFYDGFMYPTNLYKSCEIKNYNHNSINILAGNSADETNNHLEIFEKLLPYKDENIKIFAPLSYSGNQEYINYVIQKGKELFKDKFIPMTTLMPIHEYNKLLSTIDIAIFAHNRQQAMGNIVTLLGMGKKVFMKSNVTTMKYFKSLGIELFDIESLDITFFDENISQKNQRIIKEYFSKSHLIKQLKEIFEY